MDQDHYLLYDHKKPIRIKIERVSFYQQGQIIEAFSENNEVYYLFFYKSNFLTALKATKLRRQSFIENAFKKGMVFQCPHPISHALLSSKQTCQILNFNSLLKKLETNYSPQEKAYILTFFESFFPKKQLFNEIQSTFYEYRRNGQMFLGYRLVRILMDFSPTHSLVKQLTGDMNFSKYTSLYSQKSDEVFAKDLIFAEKTLYSEIENDHSFQKLVAILEKESRWHELISLFISKLIITPSDEYYCPLLKLLKLHFNENETLNILEKLSYQLPNFLSLQQDVFNMCVKTHKIELAIQLMKNQSHTLSNSQLCTFANYLEDYDADILSLQPEILTCLLKPILEMFPEKTETLLKKYVISLLKTYELAFIKEWLKPFMENGGSRNLLAKIEKMQKLSEDLDEMQILGEMYYEFRQFDKAIECFSWEMELTPTNPKPLQWLAKAYREMGMTFEAEAYQQMCISMQKRA